MATTKRPTVTVLTSIMFATVVFGWMQRQYIYDWTRLRNYQPSAEIIDLAKNTSMNDLGSKIFYVQHPELDDKVAFGGNCNVGEQTIVLGCYIPKGGIYIYKVTDPRLNGVKEVTAAHEMLHAAYERLSASRKNEVDKMIQSAYGSLNNSRISATIEQYKKNKADIGDELHSILGTEVRDLPTELEDYYGQYFKNRRSIVTLSEKYESAFTERKNKVQQYDQQLNDLKSSIDSAQERLNTLGDQLNLTRQQLDNYLVINRYDLYNAGVAPFNSLVRTYNDKIIITRNQISQYNKILDERNALAVEEQELYKAIDSRLTTQTAK